MAACARKQYDVIRISMAHLDLGRCGVTMAKRWCDAVDGFPNVGESRGREDRRGKEQIGCITTRRDLLPLVSEIYIKQYLF
jgi:hypothetical protein